MRPSASRPGFTILELLVVMAIVGISLGIFIPRLKVSPRGAMEEAGMQLVQDLDVARTRAIATRSQAQLYFDGANRRYIGYLDHDGDGTIVRNQAETEALHGSGVRVLPGKVEFGRGSVPPIPGDGQGTPLPRQGHITFTALGLTQPKVAYLRGEGDADAVMAVQVLASGGMRLWRHRAGTGWE
jgi:prepilin-type N-terminal cleavage/methylation domain-containing protein